MCLCNLEEGLFSFAAALPETVYFSRGSVAMARLLAVIQRRPAASSIQNARGDRPASVQGELHLQGVTFAYPTRPALPVLKRRAPDTARLCPPVALCFCSAAAARTTCLALPCRASGIAAWLGRCPTCSACQAQRHMSLAVQAYP